jgi:hypothetical protein
LLVLVLLAVVVGRMLLVMVFPLRDLLAVQVVALVRLVQLAVLLVSA